MSVEYFYLTRSFRIIFARNLLLCIHVLLCQYIHFNICIFFFLRPNVQFCWHTIRMIRIRKQKNYSKKETEHGPRISSLFIIQMNENEKIARRRIKIKMYEILKKLSVFFFVPLFPTILKREESSCLVNVKPLVSDSIEVI